MALFGKRIDLAIFLLELFLVVVGALHFALQRFQFSLVWNEILKLLQEVGIQKEMPDVVLLVFPAIVETCEELVDCGFEVSINDIITCALLAEAHLNDVSHYPSLCLAFRANL